MKLSDLSLDEPKELVKGLVDDRLRDFLGEPDLGLPHSEAIRIHLEESLASAERLSGDDGAEKLGVRW
jgi:hypothetical protein